MVAQCGVLVVLEYCASAGTLVPLLPPPSQGRVRHDVPKTDFVAFFEMVQTRFLKIISFKYVFLITSRAKRFAMGVIFQQVRMGAGSILGDITTIDHNIDAGGISTSINGVHGAGGINDPAQNAAIYPIECAAYISSAQRILGCCVPCCVLFG